MPGRKVTAVEGISAFWTEKEILFVQYYEGNASAAAAKAKYSRPTHDGCMLMKRPHIAQACDEKRRRILEWNAKDTARRISKQTLSARLLNIAEKAEKKSMFQPAVNAIKAIAEIEGYIIKKSEDLTRQLEGKTDEEKEFFAQHGYWPTREQLQEQITPKGQVQ